MKTSFFNPFEKYSEKKLLLFGLLFTTMGGYLGFVFNARFDGVIDLHFVEKATTYEPITDIAIAVFCTTLLLFSVGKWINKKTRLIDMISIVLIARIPFYVLTFFNINNFMFNINQRMLTMIQPGKIESLPESDLLILFIFAVITILFLIWFFALLFNGFKVATNAKGTRHTLFFIAAILIAEILSKFLISQLL